MLDTIRPIFYVVIIIGNYYIYKLVKSIETQSDCPLNTGWRIDNLKLLSNISIVLAFINLFIPCNTFLYKIPIIGSIFSVILFGIVFMQIFTLTSFSKDLIGQKTKCQLDRYSSIINKINNMTFTHVILFGLGLSIILLYL